MESQYLRQYQNVSILDFIGAKGEGVGGIRHAKLKSNRYHKETNTQLFTGWTTFLSTIQQCQSTEGKCTVIRKKIKVSSIS